MLETEISIGLKKVVTLIIPTTYLFYGRVDYMDLSEAVWKVFKQTGYFGAYLLYRDYRNLEIKGELNHCVDIGMRV